MKFNKWTLGLAAVGAVSLASVASAEEAKMSQVQTALSNTTLSGVVDIGYNQLLGDVRQGNDHATRRAGINSQYYGSSTPAYGIGNYPDGFSLNQVIISLDKPLEADKAWSAGYHVDLNFGDAAINGHATGLNYFGSSYYNDVYSIADSIRQAYVALNTPVGNGINWKVGIFDGVTGYEGNTLSANPNYSRSYGWQVNPATFTGIIGSYQIIDAIGVQAGYVNRNFSSSYGQSDAKLQTHSYVLTATFTAPESFGFLKGSALNLQTVQGFDNQSVANYSANLTLATPVTGLKFGLAYDNVQSQAASIDGAIYGIYTTYQATDKLGFALRGEYINAPDLGLGVYKNGEEVTATISYNLWENVLTRVEFRWDHSENTTPFYGFETQGYSNAFLIAANVAYKF